MNGAENLLQTLVQSGVEVCFANPGTSEMQLVSAIGPAATAVYEDDIQLWTSGALHSLELAASRWLQISADHCHLVHITHPSVNDTVKANV